MKTSPPRKVKVKDILILWKQVHQEKWKWKIFLFCENKSNMESESERYSYLVKTSPTKKVKVNDFFMFNFSKGLGAPIGSLVLGRYLPWSSFVCWITKRKKVVSSNHRHPPHYSAQRRDDLESTAFEKSTRWRDATNRFCIMYFLCICICTLYYWILQMNRIFRGGCSRRALRSGTCLPKIGGRPR